MDIWVLVGIILKISVVVGVTLGAVAYLILVERKVAAFSQDRLGPNRCGREFGIPFGLLQALVDGAKMVLKEDIVPRYVNKPLFILAPAIAIIAAMIGFAVVPFGVVGPGAPHLGNYRVDFQIAPGVDVGIVYIFAIGSLAVYGVILGGWASNNKYSFLGGLRSSAQLISYEIPLGMSILGMVLLAVYGVILGGWASNNKYSFLGGLRSSAQLISYEIPLGMSILGMVLLAGSLDLNTIVNWQDRIGLWGFIVQPLGCLLFVISAFAETNRLPFDLPEAEQELIGGYHTEYSAMKFGMFFLGEYLHVITVSYMAVILFFGGWDIPFLLSQDQAGWFRFMHGWDVALVKMSVIAFKVLLMILFMMWIRWTLPRFRYDQLMDLAWKSLIPLALVNLVATAAIVQAIRG